MVGRWQVDDLTEGHRVLIDEVMATHGKVIIFVGVAPTLGSRTDPLDYPTRAAMVLQHYPTAIVLPIADHPSNDVWSQTLDSLIRTIAPIGEVTLYGGRDSFVQHYTGGFQCTVLADMNYSSGTEVRQEVGRKVRHSADFRAGAIYSCFQQRKRNNLVVDVAVIRPGGLVVPGEVPEAHVLLGKKPNEDCFRFPGGFVDPTDPNVEYTVRREVEEETGVAVGGLRYVGSYQQDDWRMGVSDRMLTFFFAGTYTHGALKANDDLEKVQWVPIEQLNDIKWHPDHEKLRDALLAHLK
jgi:bifunctional NMN adenylyltransferase/nudix hydrolase